ncbi:MAG: LysR family transcriptional regulator [Gammaproteobacteria bacterium]|nr:LysR family transcriptional regulator [Gammaproteobacteria bacterium]
MNLDLLRSLHAVVKTGSINQAAEILCKTQPAVSMAIKRLEQDVGFTIFHRNKYRLQLTDKGKIFYQKSRVILEQVAGLESLTDSFRRGEEHQVNIAIESSTNINANVAYLKALQHKFPNTELLIKSSHQLNSLTLLQEGSVDLVISPWLVTFESEGNFESKLINNFSFFLCGHKSLFEPFGITESSQITNKILSQLPQVVPQQLALNIQPSSLVPHIGKSIIKLDDIHYFIAALKAPLGWGAMSDALWNDEMEQEFFKFSFQSSTSPIIVETRLVKNRNQILGPAAQFLWDSF